LCTGAVRLTLFGDRNKDEMTDSENYICIVRSYLAEIVDDALRPGLVAGPGRT